MYQKLYNNLPVSLQRLALSAFGFKQSHFRYSGRFNKFLDYLEKNQWKSTEYLLSEQNELLQNLIIHVYENVPYYKNIFDERKLKPGDVKTREDLQKLPFLTKDIVRKNFNKLIATNIKKRDRILVQSGGTTGPPLYFYSSKELEGNFNYATMVRLHRWAGYDITKGMKRAKLGGRNFANKPPYVRFNRWEKQLLLSTYHLEDNIDYYADQLTKFKPDIIDCHPSAIFIFAKKLLEKGKSVPIPAIWTSCEQLFQDQREIIEKVFNCKIFNEYGQTELVTRASECEKHNGFHLTTELGITEIIRFDNSLPSDWGEIVGTSLRNYVMPLIRYRMGDIASQLVTEKCECDRGLPRVMKIEGRKDDIITDTKGQKIAPVIVRWTFYDLNLEGYQIQQIDKKRYNVIIVNDSNNSSKQKLFEQKLANLLGKDADFNIETVDKLNRTSFGKVRTTVNKMK